MWSDPDDIENWAVSPRGAGWLFGGSVVKEVSIYFSVKLFHLFGFAYCACIFKFNHVNSLNLIARAHQLVQEGFKYMFDKQLVTVWSAPNYCYRCGNKASIMTVHEDASNSFAVYDAAPENDRDKGQFKRLVSFFFRAFFFFLRSSLKLHTSRLICHILYEICRFNSFLRKNSDVSSPYIRYSNEHGHLFSSPELGVITYWIRRCNAFRLGPTYHDPWRFGS